MTAFYVTLGALLALATYVLVKQYLKWPYVIENARIKRDLRRARRPW